MGQAASPFVKTAILTGGSGIEYLIGGLSGEALGFILTVAGLILTIAGLIIPAAFRLFKHRRYFKSEVPEAMRMLIARSLYAHLSPSVARKFAGDSLKKLASEIGARETTQNKRLTRATRLFIEQVFVDNTLRAIQPKPSSWLEQTREQHLKLLSPTFDRSVSRFNEAVSGWEPHEIETAFELHSAESATPPIGDYFAALRSCKIPPTVLGKNDRFLSQISISRGFVAPLLVLTGILKRTDEDWPRAIKRFNEAIGESPLSEDAVKKEPRLLLANVQAFEFYCWLLWGPSIQICKCALWAGDSQILQYGFGDEGWSMHLVFEDLTKLNWSWEEIERRLAGSGRPYPLALQTALVATPMWGSGDGSLSNDSQHSPGGAEKKKELPDIHKGSTDNGLLLLCESTTMGAEITNSQAAYYSAYLWVMFEICDPKNRLKWLDQPWRRYLPIFEHANIADGATLLVLKRQLVEKAISLIASFERMFCDPERDSGGTNEPDVFFKYICAIDDPGASPHRLRFSIADAENERIRALLEAACSGDRQRATRLFEPADNGVSSSCHLPKIVQQFYEYNSIAR